MTDPDEGAEGTLLWEPSEVAKSRTQISRYMRWLDAERGLSFSTYAELWQWSVSDLEGFWESIWEYFDVSAKSPPTAVLTSREMPGARFFPGATLNYAEHALRRSGAGVAVVFRRESGEKGRLSWDELKDQVARARAGLLRLGVGPGDRVAAFLPNSPEALIAFLAAASLGATWSSASPEFGAGSVLDRFGQIAPKVLIAVDGYAHGGKFFDRAEVVRDIAAALPSLAATVIAPRGGGAVKGALPWAEFVGASGELAFDAVPFDHPLWILYSSGTTGLPKPIVQGHGGILLEHLKALALHGDLGEGDRFFWFTTTGWMMWNYLVSGLTVGAAVVLYEGSPGYPDLNALFRLAEEEGVTYFGTSAPFILACHKAGLQPKLAANLSRVRTVGSTGAPLPPEGFAWVYESVKKDVLLASIAGGTDVCTAFENSCPLLPVYAGELQCHALGAKVEAWSAAGKAVVGEVGELVVTAPMPSMPLYFLNDESGERMRESYFADFPGVWRHGDWIKVTERGTSVIYGRSDSTLNRGGVRMGTSEFYRVVEALPEVQDSVVVDTGSLSSEGKLHLFVVLAAGVVWNDALKKKIAATLRSGVSPRHVPDDILPIPEVPRTLSGKKLEVPIKRILMGAPRDRVLNAGTLANPKAVDALLEAARPR
jgi:acetoacetyl-CoA synthetase